jgi:hypothetical protein
MFTNIELFWGVGIMWFLKTDIPLYCINELQCILFHNAVVTSRDTADTPPSTSGKNRF